MDALLGASGLEDIGVQFPNTDNKYKDISSLLLLEMVGDMVKNAGFLIVNIDAVIILEYPRISPYIRQMRMKIAESLKVDRNQINIKATTSEGIGFCGRREGAAAQSVALLNEINLP
jgi:2-C-methyl-D-erythritol 2,4-cyclodiphosphate synthase